MRPDPFRNYRFRIEVNGTDLGGFQTVSGLERQCELEPFQEGGINDYAHQLVRRTSFPPLVLKRGLVESELWDWHQDVIDGDVERKTISIILLDETGEEAWRWICADAFPSKWTGAELEATASGIATESVELVHHGMRRQ